MKLRPPNFFSLARHASFGKDLSCIKSITGSIAEFPLALI